VQAATENHDFKGAFKFPEMDPGPTAPRIYVLRLDPSPWLLLSVPVTVGVPVLSPVVVGHVRVQVRLPVAVSASESPAPVEMVPVAVLPVVLVPVAPTGKSNQVY
jgi:hypothetical protein